MTHIVLWKKIVHWFLYKKNIKKNKNLEEHRKSIFMRVCDWKKKARYLHKFAKTKLDFKFIQTNIDKKLKDIEEKYYMSKNPIIKLTK